MSNKITVTLDGRHYRLSADEDSAYMQEVADYVSQQMAEVRQENQNRSGVDCATLTALNLADALFKERESSDDLRAQLKQALDDTRKAEQKLRDYKKSQRSQSSTVRNKTSTNKVPQTSQPSSGTETEPEKK